MSGCARAPAPRCVGSVADISAFADEEGSSPTND